MLKDNVTQLRNKINQQIFAEIIDAVCNGREISDKDFINNPDTAVSSVAADACASSYELSNMWTKDGSSYYKEEYRLTEIILDVYNKYLTEIRKDEKKKLSAELKLQMENSTKLQAQLANLETEYNSSDEQRKEELDGELSSLNEEIANCKETTIGILNKINQLTQEIKELSLKQGRVT